MCFYSSFNASVNEGVPGYPYINEKIKKYALTEGLIIKNKKTMRKKNVYTICFKIMFYSIAYKNNEVNKRIHLCIRYLPKKKMIPNLSQFHDQIIRSIKTIFFLNLVLTLDNNIRYTTGRT